MDQGEWGMLIKTVTFIKKIIFLFVKEREKFLMSLNLETGVV